MVLITQHSQMQLSAVCHTGMAQLNMVSIK